MLTRLLAAIAVMAVSLVVIVAIILRRDPDKPTTWVGAILGAVLVAGVGLVAYGQVPHEWITYADAQLGWGRRDLVMWDLPDVLPFDISRMAVRDVIAANIYMINFAITVVLFRAWQNRGEIQEKLAERRQKKAGATEREMEPAGTSAYGRPVSKEV